MDTYDLSADNIDLSSLEYFLLMPYGKVSLKNKTLSKGLYNNSQLFYYIFSGSTSTNAYQLTEFNTSNLSAPTSTVTSFGNSFAYADYYSGTSSATAYDWIGTNMNLPYITSVNPYGMAKKANLIDFSGSYIPKMTSFSIGNPNGYYANIKELKLNNITAPNITSLTRFCYLCNSLINIETAELDTKKVTNMDNAFYNCSALPFLDIAH